MYSLLSTQNIFPSGINISIFDVEYDNIIFNVFLDRLIDKGISITKCKLINWKYYMQTHKTSKYKKYFIEWTNEYNTKINKLNDSYIDFGIDVYNIYNRTDDVTIDILKTILNYNYLHRIYPIVPLSHFKYLNQIFKVYNIPDELINFVEFTYYYDNINDGVILNEHLIVSKLFKDSVSISINNLNDNVNVIKNY